MTLLRLSRRTPLAVIAIGVGCHLGGCLATTKHLEEVEQGVTSRGAWTDERIGQLDARIDETRAENEALRVRMDDLADQISALGRAQRRTGWGRKRLKSARQDSMFQSCRPGFPPHFRPS